MPMHFQNMQKINQEIAELYDEALTPQNAGTHVWISSQLHDYVFEIMADGAVYAENLETEDTTVVTAVWRSERKFISHVRDFMDECER